MHTKDIIIISVMSFISIIGFLPFYFIIIHKKIKKLIQKHWVHKFKEVYLCRKVYGQQAFEMLYKGRECIVYYYETNLTKYDEQTYIYNVHIKNNCIIKYEKSGLD